MQTAWKEGLCLPAGCALLDSEEMTYLTGGAGIDVTFPLKGLLPDIFRRYSLAITFTFSWDGKGLMEDFPELKSQLSRFFPMSISFKLV